MSLPCAAPFLGVAMVLFALPNLAAAPDEPAGRGTGRESPTRASPPPANFEPIEVLGVVPTEEGNFVILVDAREERMLPLDVGLTEALAIHVRLERQRFPRPLTIDLLDDVLQRLDGRVVRVQIDGFRDETFLGTVFIEQGKKVHRFDARPSDAIALALGQAVPIFIDREVMATHSLDIAELEAEGEEMLPAPDDELRGEQKPIVKL